MTDPNPISDDQLAARVRELITHAVATLDPADRDARIAWCREHDQHGTRMHTDPDGVLRFDWGGRTLVLVRAADLTADKPIRLEFVNTDIPDTVPDEWPKQ